MAAVLDPASGEPGFDAAGVARCLLAVAGAAEWTHAFFERTLLTELRVADREHAVRVVAEEGLAVRQRDRGARGYLQSSDEPSAEALRAAALRVARCAPVLMPLPDGLDRGPWPAPDSTALCAFAAAVEAKIRDQRVGFPLALVLEHHWRSVRLVSDRLATPVETTSFCSVRLDLPGGRCGFLCASLGEEAANAIAHAAVQRFLARGAPPPPPGPIELVLGPGAAGVLLHEAVGHALEADLLVPRERPQEIIGRRLGTPLLDVLDDPAAAPEPVRRDYDDEGSPVLRRWLLRRGVVAQPLADRWCAATAECLLPGAGRTAHRTLPVLPRCSHLVLLPGTTPAEDLALGTVWYAPEAVAGAFDPETGRCWLELPYARRWEGGRLLDRAGPFRIGGLVSEVLERVVAVGDRAVVSGAGWCAKGAQRLPVWATTPALRLAGVEVLP